MGLDMVFVSDVRPQPWVSLEFALFCSTIYVCGRYMLHCIYTYIYRPVMTFVESFTKTSSSNSALPQCTSHPSKRTVSFDIATYGIMHAKKFPTNNKYVRPFPIQLSQLRHIREHALFLSVRRFHHRSSTATNSSPSSLGTILKSSLRLLPFSKDLRLSRRPRIQRRPLFASTITFSHLRTRPQTRIIPHAALPDYPSHYNPD